MKNIIVHLTLTTILFISGTFENRVLCLLQLIVYYIYLMPHDIDVRLLFQVLCFVFLIEQCDIFLDIDFYLTLPSSLGP